MSLLRPERVKSLTLSLARLYSALTLSSVAFRPALPAVSSAAIRARTEAVAESHSRLNESCVGVIRLPNCLRFDSHLTDRFMTLRRMLARKARRAVSDGAVLRDGGSGSGLTLWKLMTTMNSATARAAAARTTPTEVSERPGRGRVASGVWRSFTVDYTSLPLDIYTRRRIIILDYGDSSALIRVLIAGWSSPEAREAHNLKVAGSNPAPAIPQPTLVTFHAPCVSAACCRPLLTSVF
jgi:hypothetical protein